MRRQASLKGRNANRLIISFLRLLSAPLFLFSKIRLLNTFGFLISFILNIVKASNKLTARVHKTVYQLAEPQALFILFPKSPIKFFIAPLLIIFPSALIMFALLSPSVLAPTNVSLNYVYNGTDWVPWNATSDGKPRVDLNLLNITAGSGVFSSWANATYLNASQWVNSTAISVRGTTVFNSIAYTWPSADGSANQVLTTNGAGALSWAAGRVTGEGTATYLALWNGTSTINRSDIYQSGGNVGIGTTSPQGKLNVVGGNLNVTTGNITLNGTGSGIVFNDGSFTKGDVSARVYNSVAISIANNVAVAITFDSERWDTDTIHSTVSNTGRLTATTAGKYYIHGHLEFQGNTNGFREISIRLNGVTTIASLRGRALATADSHPLSVSTHFNLAANDYVELMTYQESGVALNVQVSGNFGIEFGMMKLG